jgi:protocatechuate 3,4-dioxygenase beta subunit
MFGTLTAATPQWRWIVALFGVLAIVGCDGDEGDDAAPEPAPREESAARSAGCRPGAEPTPEQTEGPYYRPGPPRRTSLAGPGVEGRRLVLRGRVLSTDCRPLAGARVDFWQADGGGRYDNRGYRLRGWQRTDRRGRYRLLTVVPGRYEPRTPHIHVKVTPRGGDTVTTQLYLPGEARNRDDPIFDRRTVLMLGGARGSRRARFDFVVRG